MLEKLTVTFLLAVCFRAAVSTYPQNFQRPHATLNYRIIPLVVTDELKQILDSIKPNNRTHVHVSSPATGAESCDCGIKGANRIVGGTLAGVTEWPWQAYLYIDKTYMCGGAVLNYDWVITAAHCVSGMSNVEIFLGLKNLKNIAAAKHVTTASSINIHENYEENDVMNDIALLKLTAPVPSYSTFIKPVCLPYKYKTTDFQRMKATVTGWGRTSEGGSIPMRLREVRMTILNRTQCTSLPYRMPSEIVTNSMFCMYKLGSDACQGDSGGPVNWQETTTGRAYQIGIVSFGKGCARRNWPGVYTRVTEYLNWIDKTAGILTIFPRYCPVNFLTCNKGQQFCNI